MSGKLLAAAFWLSFFVAVWLDMFGVLPSSAKVFGYRLLFFIGATLITIAIYGHSHDKRVE